MKRSDPCFLFHVFRNKRCFRHASQCWSSTATLMIVPHNIRQCFFLPRFDGLSLVPGSHCWSLCHVALSASALVLLTSPATWLIFSLVIRHSQQVWSSRWHARNLIARNLRAHKWHRLRIRLSGQKAPGLVPSKYLATTELFRYRWGLLGSYQRSETYRCTLPDSKKKGVAR